MQSREMQFKFIVVVCCILLKIPGCASNTRYISPHGNDSVLCGGIFSPCQTIDYTTESFRGENLTLYIDGGVLTQMEYKIKESIKTNVKYLQVKKNPLSIHKPIFIPETGNSIVLFEVDCGAIIQLESVIIQNLTIVSCKQSCQVFMNNATLNFFGTIPKRKLIVYNNRKTKAADNIFVSILQITYSKIIAEYGIIYMTENRILISNTRIQGSLLITHRVGKPPFVQMENVTFSDGKNGNPLQLKNCALVTMKNIQFNLIAGNISGVFQVNGNEVGMKTRVHVTNMTIQNCRTAQMLIFVKQTYLVLTSLQLINNTIGDYSPAIYAIESNVTFINISIAQNNSPKLQHYSLYIRTTAYLLHWMAFRNHLKSIVGIGEKSVVHANDMVVKDNFFTKTVLSSYYVTNHGYFCLQGALFENNTVLNNIIGLKNVEGFINNVLIRDNEYKTAIYFLSSAAHVSDVVIVNNIERGLTKSIYYNSLQNSRTFNISNVSIHSSETLPNLEEKNVAKISVQYGSNLSISNVTIRNKQFQYLGIQFIINAEVSKILELDLTLKCQQGANPTSLTMRQDPLHIYQASCRPCPTGKYINYAGVLNLQSFDEAEIKNKENDTTLLINEKFLTSQCRICETGGVCQHGWIRSRGNFYGIEQRNPKENGIKFFACPSDYCCSSKEQCTTFNSCENHRTGTLCGACDEGFTESYFSTRCIDEKKCKNITGFWILYCGSVLVIVMFIIYIDKVFPLLTSLANILLGACCRLMNRYEHAKTMTDVGKNLRTNLVSISLLENETQKDSATNRENTCIEFSEEGITTDSTDNNCKQIKNNGSHSNVSDHNNDGSNRNSTKKSNQKNHDDQCNQTNRSDKSINTHSISCTNQNNSHIDINHESNLESYNQSEHPNDNSQASSRNIKTGTNNTPQNKRKTANDNDNAEEAKPYTIAGILGGLISFYQIKSLLIVRDKKLDGENSGETTSILEKIFNLNIVFQYQTFLCPTVELDIVKKYLIKDFIFNLSMPIVMIFFITFTYIHQFIVHGRNNFYYYTFISRLQVGYLRVLLLIYKNIANFSIIMLSCVSLNDESVLFLQGTKKCFTWWQYIVMVFLVLWVIPFPLALKYAYNLYHRRKITVKEMLYSVSFPILTPVYQIRTCATDPMMKCRINQKQFEKIKQLFDEPYRTEHELTDEFVFWESYRLVQRFIIAAIHNLFIHPLERICYITVSVVLFLLLYWKVQPFKRELYLLHWIEVTSLSSFIFHLISNQFKSFIYVYNIRDDSQINFLRVFFYYAELVFTPVICLIIYFVILPTVTKIGSAVRRFKG